MYNVMLTLLFPKALHHNVHDAVLWELFINPVLLDKYHKISVSSYAFSFLKVVCFSLKKNFICRNKHTQFPVSDFISGSKQGVLGGPRDLNLSINSLTATKPPLLLFFIRLCTIS